MLDQISTVGLVLKAGDLSISALVSLLGRMVAPQGERPRLWLEAADGWTLDDWPGREGTVRWCGANRFPETTAVEALLERSQSGRLFMLSGELRWRCLPALGERCQRVVFLGNKDLVGEDLTERPEIRKQLAHCHRWQALLWGQQTAETPGEWIELRIPHRFRYPWSGRERASRLQAILETWSDVQGEPQFVRLCDLQPFEEI